MYLHLGGSVVIQTDRIVGIFDLDTATVAKNTRKTLAKAEKNGDVLSVTTDLPKSFIVVEDKERRSGQRIYLSHLSSATLLKRAGGLPLPK